MSHAVSNAVSILAGSECSAPFMIIGPRVSQKPIQGAHDYLTDEGIANRLRWNHLHHRAQLEQVHSELVEHALSRLEEFEDLKEDWDSYGASPINMTSIEEARRVFRLISKESGFRHVENLDIYPIPTNSGGVVIYIELKTKELRVKFSPSDSDSVILRVDKRNEEEYHYTQYEYRRTSLTSHFDWLLQNDESTHQGEQWLPSQMKTTSTSASAFIISDMGSSSLKLSPLVSLTNPATKMTVAGNQSIGADTVLLQRQLLVTPVESVVSVTH